ncbi:hypothetical protein MUN89_06195 [Halobacillus salinarum]|uniref:Uncharacterized protein n=1 Tax=Halobacillus salinarum TaxID=2932257 RepID=A0ABY4EM62_9BACI|nr:hypothetical protein [Halobacillus salinarum]UOQ45532.1 hypothetical protein MUN89_06195 [Halobacillus salinarum]
MMPTSTITLKEKNDTRSVKVRRMTVYQQSRIVETIDDTNEIFYVFFHQDKYLNYVPAKKVTKHSHAAKAFKQGVVLYPPHPLIETVISEQPHYKKQSFNDLFKKLQKQHSLQETALIASYFESFIKKANLIQFIKNLYYEERRDGKLLSCYRILHVLKDMAPENSLVDTFSSDLQFTRYDELYKNEDQATLAKDPIYVEKHLYLEKDHDESFQKLSAFYNDRSRWIDLVVLYTARIAHAKKPEDFASFHILIGEHFDEPGKLAILEDLYKRLPDFAPLQQQLLTSYLNDGKVEAVLTLITQHSIKLAPPQSQQLFTLVKQNKISTEMTPEALQNLVLTIFEAKDDQAEDILHQSLNSLLSEHDITYIQEWAAPFKEIPKAKPLLKKIDEMHRITEDPNEQRRLGELYHFFHQPKQAIECMSWDMELRTDDPEPVQWLAKLYHELGMDDEHKAYQQLYIDMVKRA